MSAARLRATTLWTQLVIAMRADGILPEQITQTGPATAAVIIEATTPDLVWLAPNIHPKDNKRVLAVDLDGDITVVIWLGGRWWREDDTGHCGVPINIARWTHIKLPTEDKSNGT